MALIDLTMSLAIKLIVIIITIIIIIAILMLPAKTHNSQQDLNKFNLKNMKITSPVFENNGQLPRTYGCNGQGVNPPLIISGQPTKTASLVLIVDDPDAPGGDFVHWLVWNIAPGISEIKENSVPLESIQGLNSDSENNWVAPCPPAGIHHYQFKVYALDILLDLPPTTKKAELLQVITGHILDQAMIVGLYQR